MALETIGRPLHDLLCEALETELGGVSVYRMAILCADHDALRAEWKRYLAQTERHVEVLRGVFERLDLDPEATTPGRTIVRDKGQALVSAMRKALKDAPDSAQKVAAECVVDAETKDHQNWSLLGELAGELDGELAGVLGAACREVEDEEDAHLYHNRGWCRELWLESLGLPFQIPPLEEEEDVRSELEAAEAGEERKRGAQKKSPRKVGRSREKRAGAA